MKPIRVAVFSLLILGIGVPAHAGDLLASTAKVVEAQEGQAQRSSSSGKVLQWTGVALFVGGMATGLYGFINDRNGEYSEFGEADSSNKKLGAAGLSVAFAGGVLLLAGTQRSSRAAKIMPAVSVGTGPITVSKTFTW